MRQRASLVAGAGLLLMAVVAGWASFAVFERLFIPNDAAKTASNIIAAGAIFRLGILGFFVVAMLDVCVSWGLFVVFAHTSQSLSRLAAWFRLAYAAVFVVAIAQLLGISQKLEHPLLSLEQNQALILLDTQNFKNIWDMGLLLFAVHLLLLGVLAWRSGFLPKWLALLLLVSGIGYGFDGVAMVLGLTTRISGFTFWGEFLLSFWLLWLATQPDKGAVWKP